MELFAGHQYKILHINCEKRDNKCNYKFGYLITEPKEDKNTNEWCTYEQTNELSIKIGYRNETFFRAEMNGSVFERKGATLGVRDNRSNHEFMYEGFIAKLLLSAKICMSLPLCP